MDDLSAGDPLRRVTTRIRRRRHRRVGAARRSCDRGARLGAGPVSAPVGSLSSPLDMARAASRGISLYAPERSPCAIDLSDNTNLFGVPPVALSILRRAEEATISRYPSLYALTLKGALAA